jgi:hypothetical protein
MKLHVFDIPDDPAQLPRWLEEHLVGPDLAELVAELSAVHGLRASASLHEVLGGRREEVLSQGLAALPQEALRSFLRQPHLLLELQEIVLTEGGPYWDELSSPALVFRGQLERGRERFQAFLEGEDREEGSERRAVVLRPVVAWYRRPWVVSMATAAAMLVGVGTYHWSRPPADAPLAAAPTGWGWTSPAALPADVPADVYLTRLADAAEEWFKKRPEEPVALATRLAEFRQGCSVLLLAKHEPLAAEDRQWLLERCRLWARKLHNHLVAVEVGRDPLEVRAEADETVNQLIAALRERARG